MKTVGITGAGGFLGKHLAEKLRAAGFKVDAWDRKKGNLMDPRRAARFVKGKDVIVHLAGVNRGSDLELVSGNIIPTFNLVSAAKLSKRKPKIIFSSSIHAAGDSVYGLSKRLCETMLENASGEFGIPVSIFRFTNIFGPGSRPEYNSAVATFAYGVVHNKHIKINDPKKRIRLLYVDEAVKIIEREIARKNKFSIRTILSSNEVSLKDLVSVIKSLAKKAALPKNKFERQLVETIDHFKKWNLKK